MLTLIATLALSASTPAFEPAALIGCHPHPGKGHGCSVPYGKMRPAHQLVSATPDPAGTPDAHRCHPEPSKNRGCNRAHLTAAR